MENKTLEVSEPVPLSEVVNEQVTSKNTDILTRPSKNPKRVAAGKLIAEKTKQAREAQRKASIEAAAIIAKEKKNQFHLQIKARKMKL